MYYRLAPFEGSGAKTCPVKLLNDTKPVLVVCNEDQNGGYRARAPYDTHGLTHSLDEVCVGGSARKSADYRGQGTGRTVGLLEHLY